MSDQIAVCRICFNVSGQYVPIVQRPLPEGGGGQWVCEGADPPHVVGMYSDVGEMDLGLVREHQEKNPDGPRFEQVPE